MNGIREAENYLRYYRELHQSIDSSSNGSGCERYILHMWYVEKVDKEEIAERMRYSSR